MNQDEIKRVKDIYGPNYQTSDVPSYIRDREREEIRTRETPKEEAQRMEKETAYEEELPIWDSTVEEEIQEEILMREEMRLKSI